MLHDGVTGQNLNLTLKNLLLCSWRTVSFPPVSWPRCQPFARGYLMHLPLCLVTQNPVRWFNLFSGSAVALGNCLAEWGRQGDGRSLLHHYKDSAGPHAFHSLCILSFRGIWCLFSWTSLTLQLGRVLCLKTYVSAFSCLLLFPLSSPSFFDLRFFNSSLSSEWNFRRRWT